MRLAAIAFTIVICVAPFASANEGERLADTPNPIRTLLQAQDYPAAIAAIDKRIQKDDAPKELLVYLKGRAYYLQKNYLEAAQVFLALEKESPQSPWAKRARWNRALALARAGDFRAAEVIYRQQVADLLSIERKDKLANIYLEFADAYFKPLKEDQKPEYGKALELYRKALDVGPNPAKRIEVELRVARCLQQLEKHGEAAELYRRFAKDHPSSEQVIEALFRLGECQFAQGDHPGARKTWQDLFRDHAQANSERIAEAAFNIAKTYGLPKPESDEDLDLGVGALDSFVRQFPKHKLVGEAYLLMANSSLARLRVEDAVARLTQYLADDRYADRPETPEAHSLLGRAYQLQGKFTEALAAWRGYLTKHPAHHNWGEVQKRIVDTEFLMGLEARRAKDYKQARVRWNEFLAKYPLDDRARAILFEFGQIEFEQEHWQAAIEQWGRLVAKYPNTDESSRAQFMIAVTTEEKLNKLEGALAEFKKVTWGNFADQAKQRIARLTGKSLVIATDRVFRSDEEPKIRIVTRNIKSVTIEAYAVDMETYFRKMHRGWGIEDLDTSLIDPDNRFEFTVPGYVEYGEMESEVVIPIVPDGVAGKTPSARVLAVTVSSKALEATTMVVKSDLDVIVKCSRDEVFVFAENMRTGKPWPAARVLVSDGAKVLVDGRAAGDGVFQRAVKGLAQASDVRVFAVADGHAASNAVSLQGVGVAKGLSTLGYVYTDRPAYRAGQMVHVRGIIREVAGDTYTVPKNKKVTVEVLDPRARLLQSVETKLNEFGSFHAHAVIPQGSPQGSYRIQVRDVAGKRYNGAFDVYEYQLEPVRLSVKTDRKVFYRGEEITGTIEAAYYYGAPLAGKTIRYQLADRSAQTATTDQSGSVAFKFSTRDFRETQILPLVVTLAERGLQLQQPFFLATQGYSVAVSTVRPVELSGETFEVTVRTTDAEGKPTPQKLALKVLERTVVAGRIAERLVESHDLETGKDDGVGRVTLKLDKGAQYVLRAEGTDRFEHRVTGQHLLQISGDKDRTRLRILADRHTYKVGDDPTIRVHWREEPALALVTYQGARVLGYRLVQLKKGDNRLKVPMTAKLAPNFNLEIAVMTDVRNVKKDADNQARLRLHSAASPFTVQHELLLTLTARRKDGAKGPVRPGEEVDVLVTATDPQGKPVQAELSLSMVEAALLDRFPGKLASIHDFFRGRRRESAVRTTSSVVFSYRPETKPINERLLAEADRIALAQEGEKRLAELTRGGWAYGSTNFQRRGGGIGGGGGETDPLAGMDMIMYGNMSGGMQAANADLGLMMDMFGEADEEASTGDRRRMLGAVRLMDNRAKLAHRRARYKSVDLNAGAQLSKAPYVNRLFRGERSSSELQRRSAAASKERVSGQINVKAITDEFHWGAVVLLSDGVAQTLNEEKAAKIAATGHMDGDIAVLLTAMVLQETAYWNPTITTGEDGKATVTVTVPQRSTEWKLLAKGVTNETLAGEATGEVVAKKELFGDLKLPLAFTDGDKADIPVTIHNDLLEKGTIEAKLRVTVGEKTRVETKKIDITGKGQHEIDFHVEFERPASNKGGPGVEAAFELTVTGDDVTDVVRRKVALNPYGMPVYATTGGAASSDITAWVELDERMPVDSPTLQILIGPNVEKSLLDAVVAPAPWCQLDMQRFAVGLDRTASDLMASIALAKLYGNTRDASNPQIDGLDGRIRSLLGMLASAQQDDGGWSWTGTSGQSHRYTSARVFWALQLSRAAGYPVPQDQLAKAADYLRAQIAAGSESDLESRAILLHALSVAGQGDFSLANRLYRSRQSLSNTALAYLALAFVEMDRKETAGELLTLLDQRIGKQADAPNDLRTAALPWNDATTELRALILIAEQRAAGKSAKAQQLADWLMAHRTGYRWSPDKATGPAMIGLCQWYANSRFAGEHYKLAVYVNDREVRALDIDEQTGAVTLDVPGELLKKGKQRINFQITGRGRYTYQCIYGGFVRADQIKSTTDAWVVRRFHGPAPRELDGVEVPRGFDVLTGSYRTFRNPLTQLPVGKRGRVELFVSRRRYANPLPDEQLEYLVVTEPLPSGVTVIENSVTGSFDHFEISPGAITFYVGARRNPGQIAFEVHGYVPGEYRTGPTVVANAYQKDQIAVATLKSLKVLPLGRESSDPYRLSPKELYEYGKRLFAKGDLQPAGGHLSELLEKWNVRPEVYREAARLLLEIHLQTGPPHLIVRHFEIIKEKWPDLEISFEKIVKVAAAYHEIGEYERSFLVYRATAESSFAHESDIPGTLDSQGEFLRSISVMERLLAEYPPEAYAAGAAYALSQRVYAKAPIAADDPKLRDQKVHRVDLIARAISMLDQFLTEQPEDPAADQASFSLATALVELKDFARAIDRCTAFAERYPKSEYLDSFWYIIGYSQFALGKHADALAMCKRVAEAKRVNAKTGRETESQNKWRALYIRGQIYHSLGKAADAITEYTRVSDRFPDAKEAIHYFTRKRISLPEVSTFPPAEPIEVDLTFRNIEQCDLKVYRIDLVKLGLLERNLQHVTAVNLAGIRPYYQSELKLGDGKDYRDRTQQLVLPLKEEGAYLIVGRGADLHASSLVLVTPLAVEIQEDAGSGRVRTTVKDRVENRFVSAADVKVIGTRNDDFVSGATDLRGVHVADGIRGKSTVIARADTGQYAFFRGEIELGPPPKKPESAGKAAAIQESSPSVQFDSQDEVLLKGLLEGNGSIQNQQNQNLDRLYKEQPKGVKANVAF